MTTITLTALDVAFLSGAEEQRKQAHELAELAFREKLAYVVKHLGVPDDAKFTIATDDDGTTTCTWEHQPSAADEAAHDGDVLAAGALA